MNPQIKYLTNKLKENPKNSDYDQLVEQLLVLLIDHFKEEENKYQQEIEDFLKISVTGSNPKD